MPRLKYVLTKMHKHYSYYKNEYSNITINNIFHL